MPSANRPPAQECLISVSFASRLNKLSAPRNKTIVSNWVLRATDSVSSFCPQQSSRNRNSADRASPVKLTPRSHYRTARHPDGSHRPPPSSSPVNTGLSAERLSAQGTFGRYGRLV